MRPAFFVKADIDPFLHFRNEKPDRQPDFVNIFAFMKSIRYTFAFLLLLSGTLVQAQNPGCDGSRYKQPLFQTVKQTTLPYATAISHLGQTTTLSMDVYEPDGDTTSKRPVVILEHGGSFIFGNKTDMARWCQLLAKRGYIAVSIQYRLFPVFVLGIPDSVKIMDTAVKAVGDMKAAVRYFREDAATMNLFRADPDHIFIGGYSAGAVAALHTAFLDDDDVLPTFMENILAANGGLNGNSGSPSNQSYSSEIGAVVNMSGGLYRREWIDGGETPMSSIHGTADGTVPFLSGLAANIAYLEGSGILHGQAQTAGNWSYLKKVPGAGHTDLYDAAQYSAQVDNYWMRTTALLEFLTCYVDTMPKIVSPTLEQNIGAQQSWSVYPNPVVQGRTVSIQLPASATTATAVLYDQGGREVRRKNQLVSGNSDLSTAGLPAGIYFLKLFDSGNSNNQISGLQQLIISSK